MDIKTRLEEAISDGEVLKVVYMGGSQPGAEREIAPISVQGGKVRARCYTSNAVKLFALDKISVVGPGSKPAEQWQPGKQAKPIYSTVEDIVSEFEQDWLAGGWHLSTGENYIGLHKIGKHKKLLKYPTVSIRYDPVVHELHMDLDGNFFEAEKPRIRPWTVGADGCNTATFGKFDKAALKFIELARSLAPNGS